MTQGLHSRPLAADPLVLRPFRHPLEPPERRRPAGPQLPEGFPQVTGIGRADQPPHWIATVELGLHVGHHLDPVNHEVTDQPVDDSIRHYDPDEAGARQVTLPEFGVSQVLVLESRHARQYPLGCGRRPS